MFLEPATLSDKMHKETHWTERIHRNKSQGPKAYLWSDTQKSNFYRKTQNTPKLKDENKCELHRHFRKMNNSKSDLHFSTDGLKSGSPGRSLSPPVPAAQATANPPWTRRPRRATHSQPPAPRRGRADSRPPPRMSVGCGRRPSPKKTHEDVGRT